MEASKFTLGRGDIDLFVERYLLHRVFHVTLLRNLDSIRRIGEIDATGPGEKTFGFASNGFFRNKGCVSVFDLRDPNNPEFEFSLFKCHPLWPLTTSAKSIAILFLCESIYETLIPWQLWHTENAHRQMVVPYVEAGVPGPLSLESITEIKTATPGDDIQEQNELFNRYRDLRP